MGAVTERAKQWAQVLTEAGEVATCDVRRLSKAGFLVIPIPTYDAPGLGGEQFLTWTVMAIVPGIGDLTAAERLEELVAVAFEHLDVESATPGSYQLPGHSDPSPAYSLTFTDSISITTTEEA